MITRSDLMCGICGIIHPNHKPVDQAQLQAMNAAILHRGPDSDGFFHAPGVGLAMRRLAIIDLNTGDQPISNEDENIWIVFNGEIYNFPKLRGDLENLGHQFRTNTDTEAIIHLYEAYGPDCVQHLRGMFAFAIWDVQHQKLFVARDRLGQKPFYYTLQNGTLYFSSELPGLLQALPKRPSIRLPSIAHYLSLQYIPEPWTPYEGVYKLPAAHRGTWQNGSWQIDCYWDYGYEPKLKDSEADLASELQHRMREAVEMRLISDVPLGAHLSGGIDSSVVVALMAEASGQPVKTFSVGFEEATFSELPYARAVAERYATDHQEFILTFGDIPNTLKKLATHFGEPFADPSALPLYHLSQLTREHVTVALNGDGGDEAFAGYQRYWLDPWGQRYTQLPKFFIRKWVPSLARLLPDRGNKPVGQGVINGLQRLEQIAQIDSRASLLRWGSYFSPGLQADLWRTELRATAQIGAIQPWLVDQFEAAQAENFLDRTLYTDIHTYLPGDLLVKADRMTMAASLEGRSPFLDHELFAWTARLPADLRVRGRNGKYLLRQAFADKLPPEIFNRGKQGFGIPVGAWFRGPLAGWAREVILEPGNPLDDWFTPVARQRILDEHLQGRVDHGKRIYAIVTLALWLDTC
jgi:asparagine synthase (glutamine-hydrolysing)